MNWSVEVETQVATCQGCGMKATPTFIADSAKNGWHHLCDIQTGVRPAPRPEHETSPAKAVFARDVATCTQPYSRCCNTCGLPKGHKGLCTPCADASDQQVRDEFIRRGLVDPLMQEVQRSHVERLQKDRDYLAAKAEDCTRRHCLGQEGFEQLSDDQLRVECERRGMYTDDHLDLRIAELKREIERRDELLRGSDADRDEWKQRAEAAEKNNVSAIRAERVRLLHPRLRSARPDTLGEVWQQYALGEISAHDLETKGCRTVRTFADDFGIESVPLLDRMLLDGCGETGPGIAALHLPSLKTETVDLATLADLLADDAR